MNLEFEEIEGTRFNDTFAGSRNGDYFWGGQVRDSYNRKGGFDSVSFNVWFGSAAPSQVSVDMRLAKGQVIDDGFGSSENMIAIERVYGGIGDDRPRCNGLDQVPGGHGDSDSLFGHGGSDDFRWTDPVDTGDVDTIGDFGSGGPASERDVLSFEIGNFANMTCDLVLVNGRAATAAVGTFVFERRNDTLYWDWDSDGTGAQAKQAIAVLTNVNALSEDNFYLFGQACPKLGQAKNRSAGRQAESDPATHQSRSSAMSPIRITRSPGTVPSSPRIARR